MTASRRRDRAQELHRDSPHLPHPAPIEAYGGGGFRFGGLSHRGSLLCLPSGVWASAITMPAQISETELALVLSEEPPVTYLLIGTGSNPWTLPNDLRETFRARKITVETMTTGAAVRTYNILLGERRPIAALLIAVA
jgi:uncharacterized protein